MQSRLPSPMLTSRPAAGFTLIELMIVTALLAIITTISVTSYRQYMLRANRTDASAFALRIAAAQELFYLDNNTYTNDLGVNGLRLSEFSENGYYEANIDLNADAATGFTANVTPVAGGPQDNDPDCRLFTIDETGQRGSDPEAIDVCWR